MVRLPEMKPQAFQAYVHWVYTGEISPMVYFGEEAILESNEKEVYIEVYIIGEFLDDAKLRSKVLDIIVAKLIIWTYLTQDPLIHRIYEATPAGSPLRRLLFEEYVILADPEILARKMTEVPEDFVADVVMSLVRKTKELTDGEMVETLREACNPGEGN